MIKLEKEFEGKGEVRNKKFTQIGESDYVFIYKVEDRDEKGKAINTYYEVFRKKVREASKSVIGGVEIDFEEKEIYPKANDWGWKFPAYTCKTFCEAMKKFEQLNEKLSKLPKGVKGEEV